MNPMPGPPPTHSESLQPIRGQVYLVQLEYLDPPEDRKPFVVVSNNARNRRLDSYQMVRVTTTAKPVTDTIVPLPDGECLHGNVLCDDPEEVFLDQIIRHLGGLSISTMRSIDNALKAAFGLS